MSGVIITPFLLCCIWLVQCSHNLLSHTPCQSSSSVLCHRSHSYCNYHLTVHRAGGDPCALHTHPAGHDYVRGNPSVGSSRSRVIGVSPRPRTWQKGVSRGALGVTVCETILQSDVLSFFNCNWTLQIQSCKRELRPTLYINKRHCSTHLNTLRLTNPLQSNDTM